MAVEPSLQTAEGTAADDDYLSEDAVPFNPEAETQLERIWSRVRNYGFSVGKWNLVLPEGLYSEVLIKPAITPMPNSPPYFSGLTNLRGNLVPVYNLSVWLETSHTLSASSHSVPNYALLIDNLSCGAAIVIDNKPRTLDLSEADLLESPPDAMPESLRAVVDKSYSSEEEHWYLINHQALFMRLSGMTTHDG